jgi:predicted DNA-binding transcriptional regulator YafY
LQEPAGAAVPSCSIIPDKIDMADVRAAIRGGRKIQLAYRDINDRETKRLIWPVAIGYFDTTRILAAWCELRRDFRSFRTDRVADASFLEERYPERPAALRAKWRESLKKHPPEGSV